MNATAAAMVIRAVVFDIGGVLETVFVDDTDYCVAGASEAGMHAIRYLGNAQVIHEIEVLLASS